MSLILEEERTFIVDPAFRDEIIQNSYNSVSAIQGYYNGTEVRAQIVMKEPLWDISKFDKNLVKYVLIGVKQDTDDSHTRIEQEQKFDAIFADEFLKSVDSYVIKTRYWTMHDGVKWDYDVYGGVLSGLIIAEVEGSNEENNNDNHSIHNIIIPDFCKMEISEDKFFRNSNLSKISSYKNLLLEKNLIM